MIVGGGVAGLWLLNELRTCGWSAILVTQGELGGRQTGHSHGYIHRGHLYRQAVRGTKAGEAVQDLFLASLLWDEWLENNEPEYDKLPAPHEQGLFGFRSEERGRECDALWASYGLTSVPADAPSVFDGSAMHCLRVADARCLNTTWLTQTLVGDLHASIIEIDHDPVFNKAGQRITSVDVQIADETITLSTRAVVLTAGSGNQALVDAIHGKPRRMAVDRSAHMLVVEGSKEILEPVSGIFELNSEDALFLVSRIDSARNAVVWLVSDSCRQTDAERWLEHVDAELAEVFPSFSPLRNKLLWGLYYAPKAELIHADLSAGRTPTLHIDRVLDNAWCVWPIKLTLAPLAALDIEGRVKAYLGDPPGTASPLLPGKAPRIARERWQQLELQP
ncbi:MAG: FAD-dependent oxidoreductase, partial [Actinomycetota bacterium]|nr:FAD-dependent oxidoreductase [Actinomycetota bacterium]